MTDILRRAWRQTDVSTPSSTFPQEAVAYDGKANVRFASGNFFKRYVNDHQVSLFRRDLIPHIAKPGWFEE